MNGDVSIFDQEEVFEHHGVQKPKGIESESRKTSWEELCEISRVLTNQFQYPSVEDGLVWMNDNGKDGSTRFASKGGGPAKFVNFAEGRREGAGYYTYAGFKEEEVDTLVWVSNGSASMLEAEKTKNGWILKIFQPKNNQQYQGWYQKIFKDFYEFKKELEFARK